MTLKSQKISGLLVKELMAKIGGLAEEKTIKALLNLLEENQIEITPRGIVRLKK